MVHVSFYRNYGKTFKKPRRPYEKERLDAELRLVGEYGLRCKRELWRVQYALSRIRNAARELLTLDEKNPRRIFEGEALLRRMNRYGLLDESQNKLDYVLALTVENFLERRLQTLVFKSGMAKSIHHARVLIRQRHIRVGRQVVNIPSFMVRMDSQKHIDFSLTSPFGGGRPGRVKRKNQKAAAKKASGGDGDEEEDDENRSETWKTLHSSTSQLKASSLPECCQLNLEFEEAHQVVFSVIGPRSVHLTGYYVSRSSYNHPNDESEESYGEDIGDTETERSKNSEESEYEDSFINDDDPETIPSSPDSSSQRDEDMFDLKKSNDGKKTHRRLRKKYQLISESENDDSSLRKVSASAVAAEEVLDSEVEDTLPISSLFRPTSASNNGEVNMEENARKETDKRNGNDTEDNVAVLEGTNAPIDFQPESETDLRNHEKQKLVLGNHNGMPKKKSKEVKKEERFPEADHDMIGLEKNQKLANGKGNPQQNLLQASTKVGLEDGAKLKRKRKVQVGEKTLKGNTAKEDEGQKNGSNTDAVMEDGHVENKGTQEQVSEKKRKKKRRCKNEDDADTTKMELPLLPGLEKNRSAVAMESKSNEKIIQLPNGIIIEDLKAGKPDGKVRFHYTGKLKETGQVFDSNAGKAPLKFRLGGEEVLDVWNAGLDGMRVGGTRRLTVPPSVSYRNEGASENIPPNSWLVFDVELVKVR
ncbi:hypothetical protein COLO4_25101 [Corchorus olitorius]|uniref:peptidylprolyl isomerase n=1 Tax=Corchorus olitorius TaxID=93759 RepID=A0A1R3I4N0_9ROSI|nr:hypothetical protein COLO4_25101 [Corchorus olitorius]